MIFVNPSFSVNFRSTCQTFKSNGPRIKFFSNTDLPILSRIRNYQPLVYKTIAIPIKNLAAVGRCHIPLDFSAFF